MGKMKKAVRNIYKVLSALTCAGCFFVSVFGIFIARFGDSAFSLFLGCSTCFFGFCIILMVIIQGVFLSDPREPEEESQQKKLLELRRKNTIDGNTVTFVIDEKTRPFARCPVCGGKVVVGLMGAMCPDCWACGKTEERVIKNENE